MKQKTLDNTFDYINIIQTKKPKPDTYKKYVPYLANLNYSNSHETIFHANELNMYTFTTDPKLNFDYYYHKLPKKYIKVTWAKAVKDKGEKLKRINTIMDAYNCSKLKAQEIYNILVKENTLNNFLSDLDRGGRMK